jgi:hypothetical protein
MTPAGKQRELARYQLPVFDSSSCWRRLVTGRRERDRAGDVARVVKLSKT